MLNDYFEERDEKRILIECTNATQSGNELTDEQKSKCVKLIADYAVRVFGVGINKNQIKQMAIAAVNLIGGLKSKTGESTVS